jgi:hypothetical protein
MLTKEESLYERGTCNYIVKYVIRTKTIGSTRSEKLGTYHSRMLAEYALANHPYNFTRSEYDTWKGNWGYTHADITRVVEYDFN